MYGALFGSSTNDSDRRGAYEPVPESTDAAASGSRGDGRLGTNESKKENKKKKKSPQRRRRERVVKDMETKRPVFRNVFQRNDVGPKRRSKATKSKSKPSASASFSSSSSAELLPLSHVDKKDQKPQQLHHSFLFRMLDPHSRTWQASSFRRFITTVILIDLAFFVLSTDESLRLMPQRLYYIEEGVVSTVFLIEYVARSWTVPEARSYRSMNPWLVRLRYAVTFEAIVDLAAALPFFLELPTGWHLPNLTFLRFARVFRILKSQSAVKAVDAVYRVVYYNRQILWVACLLCVLLVFVTSILLYYCRPPADDAENHPLFDSMSDTLFMSTLMLTGGGGPDTTTLPWYTKAIVLLTQILSVPMFAIPASMLTWGFEAEAERMAKETRKRALERRRRHRCEDSSTNNSLSSYGDYSDGNTTDEEYFRLIAGEEDDEREGEEEETPWMKEQREKCNLADTDLDGVLTVKEYLKIQQSDTGGEVFDSPQQVVRRLQNLESKLDRVMKLLEQRK
mmetsp:Transcript_8634/g.17395  ORF Transcript_8634/g.17395 Transcript_8634/m.17395 type:complete len:509 (+) Transcript_8634:198-1724(+)